MGGARTAAPSGYRLSGGQGQGMAYRDNAPDMWIGVPGWGIRLTCPNYVDP